MAWNTIDIVRKFYFLGLWILMALRDALSPSRGISAEWSTRCSRSTLDIAEQTNESPTSKTNTHKCPNSNAVTHLSACTVSVRSKISSNFSLSNTNQTSAHSAHVLSLRWYWSCIRMFVCVCCFHCKRTYNFNSKSNGPVRMWKANDTANRLRSSFSQPASHPSIQTHCR